MTHPGLPDIWVYIIVSFMLILSLAVILRFNFSDFKLIKKSSVTLAKLWLIGAAIQYLTKSRWPLFILKLITVAFFLLVIYAGLMGTPVPERNIATVLTWNIWWAGLIISIFFLGSAWCAICPWDALATWHVKPRLWFNNWRLNNSLELTPPRWMRSVWPALIMFAGLTWLELGYGVTTSPYATALLSLVMVVLAIISLALYKNKAFCHYICPVGRTIGFYSQLAPVELRPLNKQICVDCKTLECFSGSETVDACPTKLVMGRLTQNTYCTSCGNCVQSCPSDNVAWRLRAPSQEAIESARPHWDEAWFMLVMLALTSFHGVTMMEFWEQGLRSFAQKIGDSGQLLVSFSSGLILSVLVPVAIYALVIELTRRLSKSQLSYKKIFSSLVFATLPLAFAYHLAHNLNHMIRESVGASQLLLNPLGTNVSYSGVADELFIKNSMLLSENTIFSLQALLMMFGFWVAIKVLQHRSKVLFADSKTVVTMMPVLLFVFAVNSFHLWMLMQPMVMRIGALCVVPSIL